MVSIWVTVVVTRHDEGQVVAVGFGGSVVRVGRMVGRDVGRDVSDVPVTEVRPEVRPLVSEVTPVVTDVSPVVTDVSLVVAEVRLVVTEVTLVRLVRLVRPGRDVGRDVTDVLVTEVRPLVNEVSPVVTEVTLVRLVKDVGRDVVGKVAPEDVRDVTILVAVAVNDIVDVIEDVMIFVRVLPDYQSQRIHLGK